jgi:excisionase family DNA binding protein
VAARNLSISRAALYRLISSGEIESFKVGASRRISRDAQRRVIARREAAQ